MLEFLQERASERKLRLFSCACGRSVWQWLADRSRTALEAAEHYADRSAFLVEHNIARENSLRAMEDASGDSESGELGHTKWHAADAVVHCTELPLCWTSARDASQAARQAESCHLFESDPVNDGIDVPYPEPEAVDGAAHTALLRDIFGDPYRPVTIDPRWLTSTVVDLATAIYDERAFARMPVLADALMDAGCNNEELIAHCRSADPHVRGCWVVDLLLGKNQ